MRSAAAHRVCRAGERLALSLLLALVSLHSGARAADLQRGAQLFNTCASCHSVLGDGLGPDLTGVFGQHAASGSAFAYSDALRNSGLVWNEATLRAFLRNPQRLVPGTKMTFPGYQNAADIDDVIAYLETLR